MKFPIVFFSEKEYKKWRESFFSPKKFYSISINYDPEEGVIIVTSLKVLAELPRETCNPPMPEDCSDCIHAGSSYCSQWWLGEFQDDRSLDEDWSSSNDLSLDEDWPEEDDRPENINIHTLYYKVWSKKNLPARTFGFLAGIRQDENCARTALVLAQYPPLSEEEDIDFIKRVHESTLPWQEEFLPRVIDLNLFINRREVVLFKKLLPSYLKKADPSWVCRKWSLSKAIIGPWMEKIRLRYKI